MRALIKKIKKDISDRYKGIISELPLNREYAKKFKIPERQVKLEFMKGLTKKEKEYRK